MTEPPYSAATQAASSPAPRHNARGTVNGSFVRSARATDTVADAPDETSFAKAAAALPALAAAQDEAAARKEEPLASGCFDYFPAALRAVAYLSYVGNLKHNGHDAIHDARGKSDDDADALLRHFVERGTWDTVTWAENGQVRTAQVRHSAAVAWRALRILQKECERDGAPLARGAINAQ